MATKHSKILDSSHLAEINEMLASGESYKNISDALKDKGFEISHTAIMNYDKDFGIRNLDAQVVLSDDYPNPIQLLNDAKNMSYEDMRNMISEGVKMQVLVLAEKQKGNAVRSKDLDITSKTLKVYEQALNIVREYDLDESEIEEPIQAKTEDNGGGLNAITKHIF